jgi:hypothetical protein
MFGNPETTPGGRALKFYASVRLDIRRVETIKTGTESVGNRVRVKVVKNKVAPPFRVAEFDVMYGEGVSKEGGLLDVGVAMDVVTKTGAWFNFGETRLGRVARRPRSSQDSPRSPPRSSRASVGSSLRHPFLSKASKKPSRSSSCGAFAAFPAAGRRLAAHTGALVRVSRHRLDPDHLTPTSVTRRRETSAERRERRAAVDDPAVVLEAAARFLEARSRSVVEVRRRLTSAGYRPDLVQGAIERLTELGMLDDEAFARAWVDVAGPVLDPLGRARPSRRVCVSRASTDSIVDHVLEDGDGCDRRSRPPRSRRGGAADREARPGRSNRIADPRRRRERAYALLARNGLRPGDLSRTPSRHESSRPLTRS